MWPLRDSVLKQSHVAICTVENSGAGDPGTDLLSHLRTRVLGSASSRAPARGRIRQRALRPLESVRVTQHQVQRARDVASNLRCRRVADEAPPPPQRPPRLARPRPPGTS